MLEHSIDFTEILPYTGSGYMSFFGIVSDEPFDTISITAEATAIGSASTMSRSPSEPLSR